MESDDIADIGIEYLQYVLNLLNIERGAMFLSAYKEFFPILYKQDDNNHGL